MSTIEEIKQAIGKLSLEDRAELLASLNDWPDDDWDRQMKVDAAAGKFTEINNKADAEFQAGKTRVLTETLRDA